MHSSYAHPPTNIAQPPQTRLSRWGMVLSVPLLLISLLIVTMHNGSIARAASELQVGDCVGTGDTGSIQAAVNVAVSATVINICPGEYNESVNLSLMSSPGSITLRRMPGQTGEVRITSDADPAVWISYNEEFPGSITLESLNVQATTDAGIDFATGSVVNGNIVISNVNAIGNFYEGAYLSSFYDVTVINSEFSDNGYFGLLVDGSLSANVIDTVANNNGEDGLPDTESSGIAIYTIGYLACNVEATASPYTVNVDGVTAIGNQGWGVDIDTPWDTNIRNTAVYSNALDGVLAGVGYCGEAALTITDSVAEFNGVSLLGLGDQVSTEMFYEFGGFRMMTNGPIHISNADANANTGFGFCYYSFTLENASIEIQDSSASDNLGEGFLHTALCSIFPTPSFRGESVRAAAEMGANAVATEHATLEIANSSATGNGGFGGFVLSVDSTAITMTNISALENINGIAFGNTFIGPVSTPTNQPTLIQDSLIQGNAQNGIFYGQSYLGLPVDSDQITSTNTVRSSIICENGAGVFAGPGIVSSGNIGAEAIADYSLFVDARGNWWGDSSGPLHPENIGGSGDAIIESITLLPPMTNTVDVTFAPWISDIVSGAAPSPTLPGMPVDVHYSFRSASPAYFLNNEIGDPNNSPFFTLSATNGTVQGEAEKSIAGGVISGTVNPIAPGPLVITLDGPCDLDATQNLLVATPAIDVAITPGVQGVATGNAALFTVTVSNVGDITLTDITVTDSAATGTCERGLADIGVNGSTTYTCEVPNIATDTSNTFTAQGFALIGDHAAGSSVSAMASAEILAASLAVTKTVYVDGYREVIGVGVFNPSTCALESNIFVPISSTVKYCYVVTNTGSYTVSTHTLVDSDFAAPIFSNLPRELGPGESFSTIDVGIEVTKTLYLSVTNIATWTAELAAPIQTPVHIAAVETVNQVLPVVGVAQATAQISPGGLDQDNDGIPDNVEGAGDLDRDGIPDYLDPAGPTNEAPTQQPGDRANIYMPVLRNED